MRRRHIYQFVLLLFVAFPAAAQKTDSTTFLVVESNYSKALVFADSVFVGTADHGSYTINRSVQNIIVRPEPAYSWTIDAVVFPMEFVGDSASITANFDYYFFIDSLPFGARVYAVDAGGAREYVGDTPLRFSSPESVRLFELEHSGFAQERVELAQTQIWNRAFVAFSESLETDPAPYSMVIEDGSRKPRRWIDIAALSTAAIAGALAVHYKFEADERFDQYAKTGDPALEGGFQRYDNYSAAALGVMQAGIGLFAIRLILK